MTLFVCWLVFPLVLGVLALGCGLLVEGIGGVRLPGTLLVPLGFAVVVTVLVLATISPTTAPSGPWAVIVLAATGLVLAARRLHRPDLWGTGAAVAVYAVYAAPVVLSGRATFAGYIKLDDTATWLALSDRAITHGRSLAGLAPSTYWAVLWANVSQSGYPLGSVLPIGLGHVLVRQDGAWLFQPYLSFLAALLALGLYATLSTLVPQRPLRALASLVGAQSALLYGYALWGGVKEVATAPLLPLLAVLVVRAVREPRSVRSFVPLAVASAAIVSLLQVGGGAWLAPALVPLLLLAIRLPPRRFAVLAGGFAAMAIVLSAPTLANARRFLAPATLELTKGDVLGNLVHPLSVLQAAGIWPVGDFRFRPSELGPTMVLIAAVVGAAAFALYTAWRWRAWEPLLYVFASLVGCAVLTGVGGPWLDAKALATASPALPLGAIAGAAVFFQRGRRVEGAVLALAITGGVLWSNALAYRDVWLAPRDQLAELALVGNRFAGEGPALMTEYQPYGVRHFLRKLDAEGASELRVRQVPLTSGDLVEKGGFADLDSFRLDGILIYRTLVLRRTPTGSRPPSPYRLVWAGRWYEVWQRRSNPPPVLQHIGLGDAVLPSVVPSCSQVLGIAALARSRGGRVAAVVLQPATVISLAAAAHPSGWQPLPGALGEVLPGSAGTLRIGFSVAHGGRHLLWLGGSFRDSVTIAVDDRVVAKLRHQLNETAQYTPVADVPLLSGRHKVELTVGGVDLHPGSGGSVFALGPLVFSEETAAMPVTYVDPSAAVSLCGKRLDWLEAVGR